MKKWKPQGKACPAPNAVRVSWWHDVGDRANIFTVATVTRSVNSLCHKNLMLYLARDVAIR